MKRNANTTAAAEKAAVAQHTTTERKSAERSTPMKRTATVAAIDTAWKFTPASIALNGHVFDADKYAIAEKGDVYVLAKIEGAAVRVHVGKASPVYHAALEAAVAWKSGAQPKAEKPAEIKPAAQPQPTAKAVQAEKPAGKHAKAEPAKPVAEAKPAKHAKAEPAKPVEPKAAKPAKQAKPAPVAQEAKPAPAKDAVECWHGLEVTGKGWRIEFSTVHQRTMVFLDDVNNAKQKAAIEAAGFWWSATTKSWNKKLTRKAYRAAGELAKTLTALDA